VAVQPIDLQVLFSRLSDVGREQSVYRDAQIQSQLVAAQAIAERSGQSGQRVTNLRDDEEGPEHVSDESGRKQTSTGEHDTSDEYEQPAGRALQDPSLGQNIDISG
jgi:hypothetical protein